MENSRRQIEEKKLREREVFSTPSRTGPVPTVPIPFALSAPKKKFLPSTSGLVGYGKDQNRLSSFDKAPTRAEIENIILNDDWDSGENA